MFSVKGFAAHSAFIDNSAGNKINAIGEMSTQSMTYTTNFAEYVNNTISSNIVFMAATTVRDGIHGESVNTSLPAATRDAILTISNWMYNLTITTAGIIYADQVLTQLNATFAAQASNFATGAVVGNGQYYILEWISFTLNDEFQTTVRVWFSDQSFQSQFDDYTLTFVNPLAGGPTTSNLDAFFGGATAVKALLAPLTPSSTLDATVASRNGNPETYLKLLPFLYNDPSNANNKFQVLWPVLIYGAAGQSLDVIKANLQTWILANSTHPRSDWVTIFPDIFRNNEFVLVPMWQNVALPDMQTQAGIYSPIALANTIGTVLTKNVQGYPAAQIANFGQLFSFPYRSLQIASVANVDNTNGQMRLETIYPDFINVSSTSTDFGRMKPDTQNWSSTIGRMLIVAETATAVSAIPIDMSRVIRNGQVYIAKTIDNMLYLVLAKSSYIA